MNRRGFLAGILAACAAPAIVRADSLMRIVPLNTTVLVPGPVEAMLAELDAADAFAAGLQLREWSQFDIRRNLTITRYDVRAESKNGVWQQRGCDFAGGDANENRDMARAVLAGNLQRDGLTPKAWGAFEIPNGARLI